MNRFALLSVSALALMTATGSAALAQTAAAPAPPAQDPANEAVQLEDIVVTAERRTTNAQTTAIALDVVGAETLRKNGVGDIAQLQTVAPGLVIGQNATATVVTVRGVSSRDATEIGDPAVAINVDGLFLQRPSGMNAAFFDLARIEVLRGPQGTLYGRNATGGVVNIITQRPTQEFGGYAAITGGNFRTLNAEGAINIPLGDEAAMRASVFSRQHDGYRDNSNPANPAQGNARSTRGDDEDSKGARLQFLARPTDRLTTLLSGTYIHQGGNGPVLNGYPIATAPTTPPDTRSETKHYALSQPGDLNIDRTNLLAQVDYDLGPATATYIGGFVGLHVRHLYDNDGLATAYYELSRNEKSEDYSHELRISSNNKSGFVWQGGVFYYEQDLHVRTFNYLIPNGVPVILRDFNYGVHVKSSAAFGQVSYDFTDKLKGSVGLRYSTDEKTRSGYRLAAASLTPPQSQVDTNTVPLSNIPETGSSHSKSDQLTYHVGLDYQVTSRNLLYAKVDKGYKAGGFTAIAPYDPETLLAYELGSKNRFLDNALQLNLSAFYYDYSNQQVSQTLPTGGPFGGSQTVLNAGSSRLKGVEAQVNWAASAHDVVDLSINYLDAKFKEFAVANGATNLDLSGNRLIQSPKWTLQGGYEHAFDLDNGGKLTPRIQAQYRTSSYLTFYNRSNDRQKPYSLIDATLTYSPQSGDWSVQGFVRNIGNTVVLTAADQAGPYGSLRYQFGAPRTFGVRVQANF